MVCAAGPVARIRLMLGAGGRLNFCPPPAANPFILRQAQDERVSGGISIPMADGRAADGKGLRGFRVWIPAFAGMTIG